MKAKSSRKIWSIPIAALALVLMLAGWAFGDRRRAGADTRRRHRLVCEVVKSLSCSD